MDWSMCDAGLNDLRSRELGNTLVVLRKRLCDPELSDLRSRQLGSTVGRMSVRLPEAGWEKTVDYNTVDDNMVEL